MMLLRQILGFGLLACLASLASAQNDSLRNIDWGTFKDGQYSKVKNPMTRVINNATEFQKYWADAMGENPNNAPQGLDWMKYQLIAIHLGERTSGGYSVRIESIKRVRAADISVEYAEFTPPRGSSNIQAITSPWVLTRMERKAGNLVFKKSTKVAKPTVIARGGCGCCSRCTCSVGPPIELSPVYQEAGALRRNVWFRVVSQGSTSGIATFGYRVIRNPAELQAYWSAHAGEDRMPWDPDRFEWDREQLVAVHAGRMTSSGYEIALDSVEKSGINTLTLRYTVIYPSQPQPFGATPSSPYILLRMDKTNDRIMLVRRNIMPSLDGDYGCNCRCGRCRSHR